MSDYISREEAIEAIENTDWYHINRSGELVHGANSNDDTPLYKADDVYKAIDAVPAADVVEVVRCKDCRLGKEVCGNIECYSDLNLPPEYHGYEWFCPNGER